MKKVTLALVGLAAFSLFAVSRPVAAATFATPAPNDTSVAVANPVSDDVWAAGNTVSVTAPVSGEVFAAGNSVTLSSSVGRSVWAAGNTVQVDQGSGYNAFVAGNTVTLSGTYAHDVFAAGNTITIKDGTVIEGDLHVAGTNLILNGTVKGDVFFAGQRLESSAVIEGTLHGKGNNFTFTGGSIGGDFTYQSNTTAAGLDTVKVTGTTTRTDLKTTRFPVAVAMAWFAFISFLGTLLLAFVLVALRPQFIQNQAKSVRSNWAGTFAQGLVFLVAVPVLMVIAMAILVGWQVALVLGMAYVVFLMIAHALSCVVLGVWVLEKLAAKPASLWWAALVGTLLIGICRALPWVGWILGLIFFFGIMVPVLGTMAATLKPERSK